MEPAYDTGLKDINQRVISDGVYMISPKGFHDIVLTINQGNPIGFRSLTKVSRQFFYIKYNDSLDYYTVTSLHSQHLLGIKNTNLQNDNPEICCNSDSENHLTKWQIVFDYEYIFKLKDFNYYLQFNKKTNDLFLSEKTNTNAQRFYVYPSKIIETGFYSIKSISPKNLYVTYSNDDETKNLYLSDNKKDNQLFYFVFDEKDGCYSIINIQNQKCFSPGNNATISSKINQSEFYNLDYQKWIIGTKDNHNYFILHKSNIGFMLCNSNSNNNKKDPKSINTINLEFKASDRPDITLNDSFQFQLQSSSFDVQDIINNIKNKLEIRYKKFITNDFNILKLKKINDQIFANSFFLTYLEIPSSVKKIFENAFANCMRIKHIKCDPKWLQLLPNKANVENIIIHEGIKSIDKDSFKGFHNLKYLELPSDLDYKNCDPDIFSDVYGLKTFKGNPIFLEIIQKDELTVLCIPFDIEEIPEGICANCKSLNEVEIEEDSDLKVIKPRAFAGCKLLKSFPTPYTVENIAPDAFEGCHKDFSPVIHNEKQKLSMQSKLIIETDVIRISDYYKKYINITSIDIHINVQKCDSGVLKSFDKIKFVKCAPKWLNYFNTEKIESISIQDEVTEIKKSDLEKLIHLKRLVIPQSVIDIENGAFDNCKQLTSIECCVHHLKFLNQNQIKSIILDKSSQSINETDFEGFINLEYCKIPSNIQDISPKAFENCKKLMKIDHPKGKSLINNYVKVEKDEICIKDFEGWTNLNALKIPEYVTRIEEDSFKDCFNLKYLRCDPKWYPYIPKFSIRKVIIPESVNELNSGDFDEFYSMEYIYLPKDIIINDSCIFDSCQNLRKIECNSPILTKLSEITIRRLNNKIQVRYENPIFNFQPNRSKFHDETGIARSITRSTNLDRTIVNKMFLSMKRSSTKVKRYTKKSDLSVDDLIESDKDAMEYKPFINDVVNIMNSNEEVDDIEPKETNLSNISKVCGYVFHKIIENDAARTPNVVQIYTILRLANKILNDEDDKKSKGSIAEVKAGEGKTLIITILAIIIVKYGRKVDIVTSNIRLAKQDKENQSTFFNLFNIDTAVFYDILNDPEELIQMEKIKKLEISDENQEELEFNHFNLDALDYPVVYSNSRNYEYYYLHNLFDLNSRKRDLDVVLINEVDNLLIDELDSPAIISKEVNFDSCNEIFRDVYKNSLMDTVALTKELKTNIKNTSIIDEQDIELLKESAQDAQNNKEKDIDYCNENNKIVIIDKDTGIKMPHYNWPNYVSNMVKVKEDIKFKSLPISICQITQQTYFTHYKKIAAVTGTVGSLEDEKILKEGYNVEIFKVPRNIPTEIDITYKDRRSLKKLFVDVIDEIKYDISEDRPKLIILDNESNANKFLEELVKNVDENERYLLDNVQKVFGKDHEKDKNAIERAGESGIITLANTSAIKRVDIELTKESLDAGGLHVIVPMKISNIRLLEQAVGAAGRRGEPGSASIYITKEDTYTQAPSFNQKNSNLDKYQIEFSQYIKKNLKWMLYEFEKQKFSENITIPFGSSYSDILKIFAKHIYLVFKGKSINSDNVIKNKFRRLSWMMTQTAWGTFFTSLQNDKLNINDQIYCQREYHRFIADLNNYFSPEKSGNIDNACDFISKKYAKEKNKDHIIYNGFIISSFGVKPKPTLVNKNSANENNNNNNNDDNNNYNDNNNNYNDDDDNNNNDNNKVSEQSSSGKGLFIFRIGKKFLNAIHSYKENKKNIPNESIQQQSPKFDSGICDIKLIREAMTFANEAYGDGTFSKGRVLYSSKTNDLYNPVFYVIEYSNKLLVVIRGSDSAVDWITDMRCNEVLRFVGGMYIYFHYGFLTAAENVLIKIKNFLQQDHDEIYFVGHSYAAAVCNVLCLLVKTSEEYKDRKIFSLSFAPPPSMSKMPANIQNCILQFINKKDIVPHLSLHNIRNTMNIDKIDIKKFINDKIQIIKTFPNKYAKLFAENVEKYKHEIFPVLESAKGELHVHNNIGNIYLIGFNGTSQLKSCQIDEKELKDTIYITDNMFNDHFMLEYIKSFETIKIYESKF